MKRKVICYQLELRKYLVDISTACANFTLMTIGAFSRNVGKLFSELKLVTDNLPLHLFFGCQGGSTIDVTKIVL